MPDLSDTILSRLHTRTLPGLPLPPEFIVPDYEGGSIVNLASQLGIWLGAGALGGPPLHAELAAPVGDELRRIVLVVVDALGYLTFRGQLEEPGSAWQRLASGGVLAPLTTVFPPTTSVALTSLVTATTPGAHGILGYEMWLREYGMIANMITFSPMHAVSDPGMPMPKALDPESLLALPILPHSLREHGCETHAFLPAPLEGSGLSRMHLGGAVTHPFLSAPDLWAQLREVLARDRRRRQLLWVYWPTVDTLSHAYGPDTEPVAAEVRSFGELLGEEFLDRLTPQMRAATAMIVIADHGQVHTPIVSDLNLRQHEEFIELLHILPTGENRATYLHCRPGCVDAARAYIEEHWPEGFCVLAQERVIESGLLGTSVAARTPARLGELLVLARGRGYLWWSAQENHLLGRHGSLTPEEMLVPYLAARLDHIH